MADATETRRGGLRRVKEEDLQAIEDRLLQLERRVRKEHEGREQYAARANAEKNLKKKTLYEQEHDGDDGHDKNERQIDGDRINNTGGEQLPDHRHGRWRGENDNRGGQRDHHANRHHNDDQPVALDAPGSRGFAPPSTDIFLMVTVFGLVLMAALYVVRKERQDERSS